MIIIDQSVRIYEGGNSNRSMDYLDTIQAVPCQKLAGFFFAEDSPNNLNYPVNSNFPLTLTFSYSLAIFRRWFNLAKFLMSGSNRKPSIKF